MKSVAVFLLPSESLVKRSHFHSFSRIFIVLLLMFSAAANATEWDATLYWGNKAALGTPVSGVVSAVKVNVGDFVKQGGVLLELDSRTQQAEVLAQQAALKQAKNNRDEANREMERTQELYDRTLISDHDLEVAVIQRDAAESTFQTAKSMLIQAEIELEYSTIKAPFDGWVMRRNAAIGQTIVSRLQVEPLFELVEAGFMLARISVPGKNISSVHKRKRATITVDGKKYSGQVAYVALEPMATDSTKYIVDVMFNSGKTVLRSGLPAKVDF